MSELQWREKFRFVDLGAIVFSRIYRQEQALYKY